MRELVADVVGHLGERVLGASASVRIALSTSTPGVLEQLHGRGLGLPPGRLGRLLGTGALMVGGDVDAGRLAARLLEQTVALGLGRPQQQAGLLARVGDDRLRLARCVGEQPCRVAAIAVGRCLGLFVVLLRLGAEPPRVGVGALRLLLGLTAELLGDVLRTLKQHGGSTLGALRTAVGPLLPSGVLQLHHRIVSGDRPVTKPVPGATSLYYSTTTSTRWNSLSSV